MWVFSFCPPSILILSLYQLPCLIFGLATTRFFYKQRVFSTQSHCCLAFSWIERQVLLRGCLIHMRIIILRDFSYLLCLCPCLDLGLFMTYPCDYFFIFIFIFLIFRKISWAQTHLLFYLFFRIYPIIIGW